MRLLCMNAIVVVKYN